MRYSGAWFRVGGVVVALISFGITRLVVAEAIRLRAGLPYLLSGLLPLVLGLGLTAYGVALAVGTHPEAYVRTVAKWCVIGTLSMAAVLAISSIEPLLAGAGGMPVQTSPILASNTLLAGAIGGVAIGRRTASNRQQREQNRRQANRALLLDRLLRHEVLNAVTSIRLWAQTLHENATDVDAVTPITAASDRISRTIDEVAELIEENEATDRMDLAAVVADELERARTERPELKLSYRGPASDVVVAADRRLSRVVRELVEFACHDLEGTRLTFAVEEGEYESRLRVTYQGDELSEDRKRLLTGGVFPTFDDPSTGFSLQIVRILVREYGGEIDLPATATDEIAIQLRLPKPGTTGGDRAISVSSIRLAWAALTGVVAGLVMGAYLVATSDVVPVIGALYGVENHVIAWTTHLFHSVVFAMIFAAVGTHSRLRRYVSTVQRGLLGGVTWALVLWLVAAGLVMPLWLVAVGIPAEVPNLPLIGLVSHVVWGATVGFLYPFVTRVERGLAAVDRPRSTPTALWRTLRSNDRH